MHIPYKGTGPALTDLLGGHIPMAFAPIPASHANVSAGLLRALAVTSAARTSLLPDVPTIAESGLPGFDASLYYGLVAPAGTPRPMIDKLNATLRRALNSDEVKKQLELDGTEITPSSPEQYAAFIDKDETKWSQLVKESGASKSSGNLGRALADGALSGLTCAAGLLNRSDAPSSDSPFARPLRSRCADRAAGGGARRTMRIPRPSPTPWRRRPRRRRSPSIAASSKEYQAARAAFEAEASAYWSSISEKRRGRNAKRRDHQPITLDDYVLTQPPVYTGPKRPVNPEPRAEPEEPRERKPIPRRRRSPARPPRSISSARRSGRERARFQARLCARSPRRRG